MKGWFVSNGKAGTLNFLNRYIKSHNASGGTGGSAHSVVVEHTHGATQVAHSHDVHVDGILTPESGGLQLVHLGAPINQTGWMSSEQPVITVESEGVSGADANHPPYINGIPIIRMS